MNAPKMVHIIPLHFSNSNFCNICSQHSYLIFRNITTLHSAVQDFKKKKATLKNKYIEVLFLFD